MFFKAPKDNLQQTLADFIFRNSPDAYWATMDNKVVACNDAMAKMIGTTVDKVIGLNPIRFSVPHQPGGIPSAEAIVPHREVLKRNGVVRFEWRVQTLDGRQFPVNSTLMLSEINGQSTTICFWQDISETVRLREEQEKAQDAEKRAALEQKQALDLLANGLRKLAQRDLGIRVAETGSSVYRAICQDFNTAAKGLEGAVSTVTSGINSISANAGELSDAVTDMSVRIERQAANLEQTAAAVTEITETVHNTTANVQLATQATRSARAAAENGGAIVSDATNAMSRIESSSRSISTIMSVIDEIAFQTNLLALNAGVEAARAGESGKGFAVVAQEVRALAQRTADASREVKVLVEQSEKDVGRGVTLVQQTGEALQHIVAHVQDLGKLVEEISVSSSEQTNALREISAAVNQMDQTTQQNAAMIEESTSATRALASEAMDIAQLTGTFRLGEEASYRPSVRAAA